MDFGEALRLLRAGKKVRRPIWVEASRWGSAELQLVDAGEYQGTVMMPMLMVASAGEDGKPVLRPFGGASWDLMAEDWEEVQ